MHTMPILLYTQIWFCLNDCVWAPLSGCEVYEIKRAVKSSTPTNEKEKKPHEENLICVQNNTKHYYIRIIQLEYIVERGRQCDFSHTIAWKVFFAKRQNWFL